MQIAIERMQVQPEECCQPPEAEEGQRTDSTLEPPARVQPHQHLNFGSVKLMLNV